MGGAAGWSFPSIVSSLVSRFLQNPKDSPTRSTVETMLRIPSSLDASFFYHPALFGRVLHRRIRLGLFATSLSAPVVKNKASLFDWDGPCKRGGKEVGHISSGVRSGSSEKSDLLQSEKSDGPSSRDLRGVVRLPSPKPFRVLGPHRYFSESGSVRSSMVPDDSMA